MFLQISAILIVLLVCLAVYFVFVLAKNVNKLRQLQADDEDRADEVNRK